MSLLCHLVLHAMCMFEFVHFIVLRYQEVLLLNYLELLITFFTVIVSIGGL